jgi:mannose-6-phosphate isomerase
VGECIFIPAGTVHAIGAGLVIAEIQQASDTTFRLFDWNRVDAQGNPRTLHIQQSLEVIDYDGGPVTPQTPQPTDRPHVTRLVSCAKFVLDRWHIEQAATGGGDQRCHLLAVVQGELALGDDSEPLRCGETALVPAAVGGFTLRPSGECLVLDMYLP